MRTWTARTDENGAADYHSYFEKTLLPQLRELPGFLDAYLVARDDAGLVELTAHTLWESMAAIHAFAGPDPTVAVIEPEARAFLRHPDANVVHRDVLVHAKL